MSTGGCNIFRRFRLTHLEKSDCPEAKVLESRPDSLRVKLHNLRSFVVLHMRDIRSIVNSDAAKTRSLFAKHIEKITLTPTGEHYVASGTWNFLWRDSIGGRMVKNLKCIEKAWFPVS